MSFPITTRSFSIDRTAYFNCMWTRRLWPLIGWLIGAIVCITILITEVGGKLQAFDAAFDFGLIAAMIALAYLRARLIIFRVENKSGFGDRVLTFTETDVSFAAESGVESKISWTAISFAERRGPFLMLFYTAAMGLPVPDDAFLSEADRAEVLKLIEGNVKRKGRTPLA